MLSALSVLSEIIDVLAGEIPIMFLQDVHADLGEFFIVTVDGCFYLFKFKTTLSFVLNELKLCFDFFEE